MLLIVICGVIWMFSTGRWQVVTVPSQGPKNNYPPNLSQGPRNSYPTNLSQGPRNSYPPNQRVAPPSFPPIPPPAQPQQVENPLNNKRWLNLAQECADLFDELDDLFPSSDPRQEVTSHVQDRLQEILKRSGTEVISRDRAYDDNRHRLEHPGPDVVPGTPIAKIVSPGFAVGRLVLRPARVRVATPYSEDMERHS